MATAQFSCPRCGREQRVDVPGNRCLAMHRCAACGVLVAPKEGDCCVVCSYSTDRCPVSVKALG